MRAIDTLKKRRFMAHNLARTQVNKDERYIKKRRNERESYLLPLEKLDISGSVDCKEN